MAVWACQVLIFPCASSSIFRSAAKSGRSSGSYCQHCCMMPFISSGVSVGAGIRYPTSIWGGGREGGGREGRGEGRERGREGEVEGGKGEGGKEGGRGRREGEK